MPAHLIIWFGDELLIQQIAFNYKSIDKFTTSDPDFHWPHCVVTWLFKEVVVRKVLFFKPPDNALSALAFWRLYVWDWDCRNPSKNVQKCIWFTGMPLSLLSSVAVFRLPLALYTCVWIHRHSTSLREKKQSEEMVPAFAETAGRSLWNCHSKSGKRCWCFNNLKTGAPCMFCLSEASRSKDLQSSKRHFSTTLSILQSKYNPHPIPWRCSREGQTLAKLSSLYLFPHGLIGKKISRFTPSRTIVKFFL